MFELERILDNIQGGRNLFAIIVNEMIPTFIIYHFDIYIYAK